MRWISAKTLHWIALACLLLTGIHALPAQSVLPSGAVRQSWQGELRERLPLLGHRNWILIVDSAYPLQTTPGVEMVETHTGLAATLRETLAQIARSRHVQASVYQDAELKEVPETDAPGIEDFRRQVKEILAQAKLANSPVSLPHLDLIAKTAAAGKDFQILVLKTDEALPYTSVFIQLDCKYWTDGQEKRLRAAEKR